MDIHATDPTRVRVPGEAALKDGDRVARFWFLFSALWFPFFATFGLIMAIKFFFPTFLVDSQWDTFGRIRPAHVNGVLFGFVSSGLLGAMFWITPRLCGGGLYRAKLALVTPFLWNLGSTRRHYLDIPRREPGPRVRGASLGHRCRGLACSFAERLTSSGAPF